MLRLTLRLGSTIPLEAPLTPDGLGKLSLQEIRTFPLHHGNRTILLQEAFGVEGDLSDGILEFEGDCSRVKWIGTGMTAGRIVIRGTVGMHVGSGMTGGDITVHGDAGDWAGAEMRGGMLRIHGNAGDCAGSAYRGASKGMRGGAILIDGHAGHELGCYLRRGIIAVGRSCGDFAGLGMIAGSLVICEEVGRGVGAGMKRGTILVLGSKIPMPPTFRFDCEYSPVFVTLLIPQLRAWGFGISEQKDPLLLRRYSGDLLALGKGELLCR